MSVQISPGLLTLPDRDPDDIYVMQFTDFAQNHNKFYELRVWYEGMIATYQAKYARVGHTPQETRKRVHRADLLKLVNTKQDKGYTLINPYDQVSRGKRLLQEYITAYEDAPSSPGSGTWVFCELVRMAEEYYNTVPSVLPSRMASDQMVRFLYNHRGSEFAKLERMQKIIAVNYMTPAFLDQGDQSDFAFLELGDAGKSGPTRRARAAEATGISFEATIWEAIEI